MAYFAIWLGVISDFKIAVSYLLGAIYGNAAWEFYDTYSGVRGLDILYAMFLFSLVALQIITGVSLIQKKKIGPRLLSAIYIFLFTSLPVYALLLCLLTGFSFFELIIPVLPDMLIWLVMLLVNRRYYGKRADIFLK